MYLAKVCDKNLTRVDALKLKFLKLNQFYDNALTANCFTLKYQCT